MGLDVGLRMVNSPCRTELYVDREVSTAINQGSSMVIGGDEYCSINDEVI